MEIATAVAAQPGPTGLVQTYAGDVMQPFNPAGPMESIWGIGSNRTHGHRCVVIDTQGLPKSSKTATAPQGEPHPHGAEAPAGANRWCGC